jgi:HSP20 family molecular chaperone IbpA
LGLFITKRTFERSFQLADYVQVNGASWANGLLHVDLVREIPEAMKPRAIPIAFVCVPSMNDSLEALHPA